MNIMSLDAAYGEGATADIQRTVERPDNLNEDEASPEGQLPPRRAAPPQAAQMPPQHDPGFSRLPPQGNGAPGGMPVPLHMQQQQQPPQAHQGPPPLQGPPGLSPQQIQQLQMQGVPPQQIQQMHQQAQMQQVQQAQMQQQQMQQQMHQQQLHQQQQMQQRPPLPPPRVPSARPVSVSGSTAPATTGAFQRHRTLIIVCVVVVFLFLGVLIAVLATKPVCAPFGSQQIGGGGIPEYVGMGTGCGLPPKSWHESVSCAPSPSAHGGAYWN